MTVFLILKMGYFYFDIGRKTAQSLVGHTTMIVRTEGNYQGQEKIENRCRRKFAETDGYRLVSGITPVTLSLLCRIFKISVNLKNNLKIGKLVLCSNKYFILNFEFLTQYNMIGFS